MLSGLFLNAAIVPTLTSLFTASRSDLQRVDCRNLASIGTYQRSDYGPSKARRRGQGFHLRYPRKRKAQNFGRYALFSFSMQTTFVIANGIP